MCILLCCVGVNSPLKRCSRLVNSYSESSLVNDTSWSSIVHQSIYMMSSTNNIAQQDIDDDVMGCVVCGIVGGVVDNESKKCSNCQKSAHDDVTLFKQPECSHLGDCPICCLPLTLYDNCMMQCCCKFICNGCRHANIKQDLKGRLQLTCPFCRQPPVNSEKKMKKNIMRRAKANDPVALAVIGAYRNQEGDYKSAFEYLTKAAELGDGEAHLALSIMYEEGNFVVKDKSKQVYHLEKAAIIGNYRARYELGCIEGNKGRNERAVKHWMIAAKQGCDRSLDRVKSYYRFGFASKEDFAASLRGHKAAVDALKSPQREAARAALQKVRQR